MLPAVPSASGFVYQSRAQRVVFGAGSLRHLEREMLALGANRALVLSTRGQRASAEAIARRLGSRAAGIFDGAAMHVPIEAARAARETARSLNADCALAVGGGSTIGLGKAIALEFELPVFAIPTTYAGSEMTPIFGITEGGVKRTGSDGRVLPRVVIYDVDLTLSLPVELSIVSGVNAMAHAAEGLYARDGNPVMSLIAEESIRALALGLPGIRADPADRQAREAALYGAWLAGMVLGSVGMALHHKLCHTLGGTLNLPHAQTHAVILPHALAYNAGAAPDAMQRIARAIGASTAAEGVFAFTRANGAPTSLRALGVVEADLDRVADLATRNPYWNPEPVAHVAVRKMLQNAFDGALPTPMA
jgi:maleylacetate reductase